MVGGGGSIPEYRGRIVTNDGVCHVYVYTDMFMYIHMHVHKYTYILFVHTCDMDHWRSEQESDNGDVGFLFFVLC